MRVNDISFVNDVSLRYSVNKQLNYCNVGYNNNKKHLKTGDVLDKSKMLSAFNRRKKKPIIHQQQKQKRFKIVNVASGEIITYALEKNLNEIIVKLQKRNYNNLKIELV